MSKNNSIPVMERIREYIPSMNLDLSSMSFEEYISMLEDLGAIKEDYSDYNLEKWQKEIANKDFSNNPFYAGVRDKIYKENRNVLIFIQGAPGTGKSYTSLKIAQDLDPTFKENLWNRVIYDKVLFFYRLLDFNYPLRKGNVIIFEEASSQFNKRSWYDFIQKAFNTLIRIFRFQNLILILNSPRVMEMERDFIGYLNYVIETQPVDRTPNNPLRNMNKWRCYEVKETPVALTLSNVSQRSAFMLKKLRNKNGKVINYFWSKKPDEEIIKEYELRSRLYKLKMMYGLTKEVLTRYITEEGQNYLDRIINEILTNKEKYTRVVGGKLILLDEIVKREFGLKNDDIKYIKQKLSLETKKQEIYKELEGKREVVDKDIGSKAQEDKDEIEDILQSIIKKS